MKRDTTLRRGTPDVPPDTRLEWYRQMCSIRAFELEIVSLNKAGLIPGTAHLYIGMEAIAVGACAAMKKGRESRPFCFSPCWRSSRSLSWRLETA